MTTDITRYNRQSLLPDIGEKGQRQLLSATVLVAGCGALGSMIASLLVRAGVGQVIIVDRDFVELSNLQRQVLFDEEDVRQALPKTEAARRKLQLINSQVQIIALVKDINYRNVEALARIGSVQQVNALVDGLDNFETRYLLNDLSVRYSIPYIYGGAVATEGMTYAFLPSSKKDAPWVEAGVAGPCLRCIFEQAPAPGATPSCDTAGVLGPVIALIAAMQCAEALKILTGNWQAVNRELQQVDLWRNQFRSLRVGELRSGGNCPCCQQRNFEYLEGRRHTGAKVLCGTNSVQISRLHGSSAVSFSAIAERLSSVASLQVNEFLLRAKIAEGEKNWELTVFADGRVLVAGTTDEAVARSVCARYLGY